MLKFQTIYPSELADVIARFTVIEEDNPAQTVNSMSYFADGLPGLMFHRSENDIFLNNDQRKLSRLFLYGQTVKPIEISTKGPFQAIIVHLFPHTIKSLFGIDADELRDDCIPAEKLTRKNIFHLEGILSDTTCLETRLNLIINAMKRWLYVQDVSINKEFQFATQTIIQSKGTVPLESIHVELDISERTFQRRFLEHVGVTPQLFRRICKFYATLNQLNKNSFSSLTEVAYDHGFADQSHFTRTFKEFTGLTPSEYLDQYQK